MLRPFGLFQQSADAIIRAPGYQRSQMHGLYTEGSDGLHGSPLGEACPQVLVDDGLERPARAARFGLKPRGNILVQRQGCTHSIKMLSHRHHDVNREQPGPPS